jgi:hypothetical protein
MSRDDFQDVLINQYRDVVEELVVESETVYRSQLDYDLLSSRVSNLIKAAKVDGLDEILERRVPDFVQTMQSGTPSNSKHLKLVA